MLDVSTKFQLQQQYTFCVPAYVSLLTAKEQSIWRAIILSWQCSQVAEIIPQLQRKAYECRILLCGTFYLFIYLFAFMHLPSPYLCKAWARPESPFS